MKRELRPRTAEGKDAGERLGGLVFSPWLETALFCAMSAFILMERVLRFSCFLDKYYYIGTILGLCFLAVVLGRQREHTRSAPPELWLLWGGALWMVFTRLMIGKMKINLSEDRPSFWALMCAAAFAFVYFLEGKRRQRVLDALMSAFCLLHLALSVLGILTVFYGNLPGVCEVVSLDTEYGTPPLTYLSFFQTHRNLAAGYFFVAMALAVLQFLRHRTLFWRLLASASLPVFYVAIALQHCRSIFLSASVFLALVVGMAVQDRLARRSVWLRILCVGLVGAVCTAVLFVGFGKCSDAVVALADSMAQSRSVELTTTEEQSAQAELAVQPEDQIVPVELAAQAEEPASEASDQSEPQMEEPTQISDQRDTLDDAHTLTGRTDIWLAVIPAIRNDPMIAVLGTDEKETMKIIHRYGPEELKKHMHHVLLQQLMTAGVPAFLLCLGYLLVLMFRCVRGFLTLGEQAAERRGLSILLPTMLIYGCFEPLLCQHTKVLTLVFALCSGAMARLDADARESEAARP